jgi:hypothetical protein
MPTPAQVVDPITIANYSKMEWQNTVNHYPTAKKFMKAGNINRDVGGTTSIARSGSRDAKSGRGSDE